MAGESQDQSFPYKFTILPESDVASLKTIDGKVDPINMVEYKDKDDEIVTPLPLYIPQDQLEAELEKEDDNKRPKWVHSPYLHFANTYLVIILYILDTI